MHKQSVIFDMDGTLFDTETIFQEEWNQLARERGLALPPDFKYAICSTSGEAMNRIIFEITTPGRASAMFIPVQIMG